ncbi:MAG: hypothetical protein LQ338_008268, partial [Usnochroma carphineum]
MHSPTEMDEKVMETTREGKKKGYGIRPLGRAVPLIEVTPPGNNNASEDGMMSRPFPATFPKGQNKKVRFLIGPDEEDEL